MIKSYNKLVRDKIPQIIRDNGETAITHILDDKTYVDELIKKLGEEYQEFLDNPSVEELADIHEVIIALSEVITTPNELERVRNEKANDRGAFKQKIFLERTE